jgi:hypothetical protein
MEASDMPELPEMNRPLVRKIVREALNAIADLGNASDEEMETFTFRHFHDYHKAVFLESLKLAVNKRTGEGKYWDVPLNPDMIAHWASIRDCVDHVLNSAEEMPGDSEILTRSLLATRE